MEYSKYLKELNKLASRVSIILKGTFIGFYIHGSFVMDAWNEETSDIDFMVITETAINEEQMRALINLHKDVCNNETGKKLEGEYIDLHSLRNMQYTDLKVANVKNGICFPNSACKLSADNLLCLIQFGKTLIGRPINKLELSVTKNQYTAALVEMLKEDKVELTLIDDFPNLYDILINTFRCIYGIQTGKVPTKLLAIEYCKDSVDPELYSNIIHFRKDRTSKFKIDKSNLQNLIDRTLSSVSS